jgi:hypothetical protein
LRAFQFLNNKGVQMYKIFFIFSLITNMSFSFSMDEDYCSTTTESGDGTAATWWNDHRRAPSAGGYQEVADDKACENAKAACEDDGRTVTSDCVIVSHPPVHSGGKLWRMDYSATATVDCSICGE